MAVSLERELEMALEKECNPLAWLLVWRDCSMPRQEWCVEMLHPEVDLNCSPVAWSSQKEYRTAEYANSYDHDAVVVNLKIDFDIDPTRKDLDLSDAAKAIRAARASKEYRAQVMMEQLRKPEGVWNGGRDKTPEDGRKVLWLLENRLHEYTRRNVWYQPDNMGCPWGEHPDEVAENKEEGKLAVEAGGDVVVKGWCYLPALGDLQEAPRGFTTLERWEPGEGIWALTIKECEDGHKYYAMDQWRDGDWETGKWSSKIKTLYWVDPGLYTGVEWWRLEG